VSVPFLSRIHESPHDYGRLTEFGLGALAEDSHLRVESLAVTGSIASFLGHQLASAIIPPAFRFRFLGFVIAAAAAVTITPLARLLDMAIFPLWRTLPLGYVLVVTKPT
jgi:hypothetical protein